MYQYYAGIPVCKADVLVVILVVVRNGPLRSDARLPPPDQLYNIMIFVRRVSHFQHFHDTLLDRDGISIN